MSELKFKTSINCGGCINAVRPSLDGEPTIEKWSVDTDNPDKILTVSGVAVTADKVVELVADAGYQIEPLAGA